MKKFWTTVATLAVAATLIACGSGGKHLNDPGSNPVPAIADSGSSPEAAKQPVKTSYFVPTFKVKKKSCYGYDLGCSVSGQVELAVGEDIRAKLRANNQTYEITYSISGIVEGPKIGTLIVDPDGTYTADEEFFDVKTKSTKIKVALTDIDEAW